MPVDVFISYRGADRVLARKLEQRLRSRWGSRVFRDETSLVPGRSWAEQLRDSIRQAKVTLALVGHGWHVRHEGEDWVRDELLGAIEAGNPVLPVLVGNTDELAGRLTALPKAFQRQAVCVSEDLAGFDVHEIESALRRLGAFGMRRSGDLGGEFSAFDRRRGGLARELSDILPERSEELVEGLLAGRSIVVAGASGSGRSALLWHIAGAARAEGHLVGTCGIDLGSRSRRTHAVVAAWIDDLCKAVLGLAPEDGTGLGLSLVKAVIKYGPDLIARQVLRPELLLPLGDDDSDEKILDAARRPTDRWAPFPPERLVSQSLSVIEAFAKESKLPLTLIVDNVETVDGSSKDLLRRLLHARPVDVRLVLATSAVRESADAEPAAESVARALSSRAWRLPVSLFADIEPFSLHGAETWGRSDEVIARWLERRDVCLGEGVSDCFKDANPYYALSALWYLVDNGHLVDPASQRKTKASKRRSPAREEPEVVSWVPAREDEELVIPGRDRLLDHMIEEFVPKGFLDVVEAGALIGRCFPFAAAYAAACPPESDDHQPPTPSAERDWRSRAETFWERLEKVDPDRAVIVCHRSADDERMISFAQVDLVAHLRGQLDTGRARLWHVRLAQYFDEPFADDRERTLDDRYRDAQAAASHWTSAQQSRPAADAERVAAKLAEQVLAYPQARRHYRRAIRLFTQLVAREERRSKVDLNVLADLFILADCLYRLGQMTRLANERGSREGAAADPTKYFEQALKRLEELSVSLHDSRLVVSGTEMRSASSRRDLPAPNVIRHRIRLCETLSGWVNLELAEWHRLHNGRDPRLLLFDALRHAEAARGEADSRWLLAATSARLAEQLVEDAAQARRKGETRRAHNLAVESQFHIERVIGLAAVSPKEERDLAEPRSRAWMVLGELFQRLEGEPRLAEWAFRRMNDPLLDVSDLVDMETDRRLGLFLLSICHGIADDERDGDVSDEARRYLERHKRWARESGIAHEAADACLSLALLELVARPREGHPPLEKAREHVDRAIRYAIDDRRRQRSFLLHGVLHAIERADEGGVGYDDERVLEAFRQAGLDGLASASPDDVLRAGWREVLAWVLHECPALKGRLGLDRRSSASGGQGTACRLLEGAPELDDVLKGADAYLGRVGERSCVPSGDEWLWQLLASRVPKECLRHAERASVTAEFLLKRHGERCGWDDRRLTLLRRDLRYAVAVHEWYRSTDPSRLLTLARESNMPIGGIEWASPKLLSGRLAIAVLDRQYGAAREIGGERFRRIESMVANWNKGADDAGALEQIFYVAMQMKEPARGVLDGRRRALFERADRLSDAYRMAVEERENLVRQAGLPLVQDLHLLDATPGEGVEPNDDRREVAAEAVDSAGEAALPPTRAPERAGAMEPAR